MSDMVIFFKAD